VDHSGQEPALGYSIDRVVPVGGVAPQGDPAQPEWLSPSERMAAQTRGAFDLASASDAQLHHRRAWAQGEMRKSFEGGPEMDRWKAIDDDCAAEQTRRRQAV
jgi:hypothetical protein